MASPIEKLPVELVDIIVAYLHLPSYQNLRLVSKQLCSLTLGTFSSRYFSKRVTTLGPPSLNRLLQSSTRDALAGSVRLLDVRLLNQEDYRNLQQITRVGIYPPPKRFPKVAKIKTNDISQEAALFEYMQGNRDPKNVIDPLSRALQRFPNIRTVRIRVNDLMLGDNVEEDYHSFLISCFRTVLNAIAKSGVKLREFSLLKGNNIDSMTKSANLNYSAFNFSIAFLLSLGSAFSSLKSLGLAIHTNHHGNARIPGWQNDISRFISAAAGLEELTLCLKARDTAPKFRADVIHSLARSVELPNLKLLRLYGCALDEEDLLWLTKTHARTLRRLIIIQAYMREGTWASALRLFREALSLEYLRLSCLRQSSTPRDIGWQTFNNIKARTRITLDTTERCERRTMREMLAEAINSLSSSPFGYGSFDQHSLLHAAP